MANWQRLHLLLLLCCTATPVSCGAIDQISDEDASFLKNQLVTAMGERGLLDDIVKTLAKRVTALEQQVNEGYVHPNGEPSKRNNVSFLASLSDDFDLKSGNTLIFDHVITNNGDAYSEHSGIFRVPRSGTYMLALSIVTAPKKHAHLGLVRNNQSLGKVFCGSNINSWHNSGALTVVANLEEGDEVRPVSAYDNDQVRGHGWSSFTGALLSG